MKNSEFCEYLIIGGGISGISASYYLQKNLTPEQKYVLLEAGQRWGGKIKTEYREFDEKTISFETGADCLMANKPWALEMVRDLGFSSELSPTNKKSSLIYNKRKLKKLPDGLMLLLPTKILPFAVTSLLSIRAKVRVLVEVFMPVRKDPADESIACFILRRMGKQMLVNIIEPLIGSIYGVDPYKQSMLATFPHFKAIEKKDRSLLLSVIKNKFKKKIKNTAPAFYSVNNGMSRFIEHAVSRLNGDCRLNSRVISVENLPDGKYRAVFADQSSLIANKIIITSPAPAAAEILASLCPKVSLQLKKIRHLSTANITLFYPKDLVPKLPDSNGLLMPKSNYSIINAISFNSNKFNVPSEEYTQIRISLGGYRTPEIDNLTDMQLCTLAINELNKILNINQEPLFSFVGRWYKLMPQYDVGHLDLMKEINTNLPENIYLCGASYHGSSIPDCIFNAKKLVEQLNNQSANN